MVKDEYTLTTIDNPCNPYDDFDGWRDFDRRHGYLTLEYLSRICDAHGVTDELGEEKYQNDILSVIDEIVTLNIRGIYRTIRPGETPVPVHVEYSDP